MTGTTTTLDLTRPLSWTGASGATATLLDELQANILKGHVREHLTVLFLDLGSGPDAVQFVRALAPLVKSARQHLEEVRVHARTGVSGTPYVGVGLTPSGYAALGVDALPQDPVFLAGMRAARTRLGDPPVSTWDAGYRGQVDAVVLIGDASEARMLAQRTEVEALIPDSATVLAEETGLGQRNGAGNGIEHFGYVDGRSQPLFLTEDVDAEQRGTDGTTNWDPAFGADRVLVSDPAAPDPSVHFGSYLVFRKLEQNVARFKLAEEELAAQLGLQGSAAALAGAMLVGRFEDGTPLTLQRRPGSPDPVLNDFTYDSDEAGGKCPFHAHIRKTNPRGSGGFEALAGERRHLMARRGQTYGMRGDDPGAELPPSARPTGGVGLLFMAFNADLGEQFEFTQRTWADNPGFPRVPAGTAAPGLDPVIGQGRRPEMVNHTVWGDSVVAATDPVSQTVRMRGGEYFFMPSRAFLNGL